LTLVSKGPEDEKRWGPLTALLKEERIMVLLLDASRLSDGMMSIGVKYVEK
jgi:hypothetical protein